MGVLSRVFGAIAAATIGVAICARHIQAGLPPDTITVHQHHPILAQAHPHPEAIQRKLELPVSRQQDHKRSVRYLQWIRLQVRMIQVIPSTA